MTSMLGADGFTFEYPTADTPALTDVSFSVDEGDVLGVVGPVEAGKTSLAMALSGFVPEITGGWTEGDLSVAGRDPRDADDNRVAMVFEDYSSQLTQLRLIDEVVAPLTSRGFSRAEAAIKARDHLADVRLEDEPEDKFTWELSGGQQQRLAIAAALAIDPEVLVFDTATDMLDPQGKAEVSDLIVSLSGEKTLVVTENDPDALVGVADDLLVLDDGAVVEFGPADDLLRDGDLFDRIGIDPPVCLEAARRLGFSDRPTDTGEFYDTYQRYAARSEAGQGTHEPPESQFGGGESDDQTSEATPAGGDVVIEAEDVSFAYPDGTAAVSDVDLTVRRGEVHAIIGGNGAGKSTLSNLLVGLMKPDTGSVTIDGTDTRAVPADRLGESVGIALQNPDEQISRQTVDEEIQYALRTRRYEKKGPLGLFGKEERYDEKYIEERAEAARELVGIEDDIREMDPVFLPRGLQRLVTIASALAPDPAAIVLDEPAAGVDSTGRQTIKTAIDRLADVGKGVVVVDHDMAFVCEVADRVTVLEDGHVATQGTVPEVFAQENREWLSKRYMRPPKIARVGQRVGVEAYTKEGFVDSLGKGADVEVDLDR